MTKILSLAAPHFSDQFRNDGGEGRIDSGLCLYPREFFLLLFLHCKLFPRWIPPCTPVDIVSHNQVTCLPHILQYLSTVIVLFQHVIPAQAEAIAQYIYPVSPFAFQSCYSSIISGPLHSHHDDRLSSPKGSSSASSIQFRSSHQPAGKPASRSSRWLSRITC